MSAPLTSSHWTLFPRDPLLVRDGRPNTGRSAPSTLPFPLPSTIAGASRTRVASDEQGFHAEDRLDALLQVPVVGPMLVRGDTLYSPAPRDAVFFSDERGHTLSRLKRLDQPADVRVDGGIGDLSLLGFVDPPVGKPDRGVSFWSMPDLIRWLEGALSDIREPRPLEEIITGLGPLPREARVHVAIGAQGTAVDGQLFSTEGLQFADPACPQQPLGLHVQVGSFEGADVRPGLAPLGGERRVVRWAQSEALWPALPTKVLEAALGGESAVIRVVLMTPAIFDGGHLPSARSPMLGGVESSGADRLEVEVVAAAVPPPLTVSGWSLRERRPKPARRAVAAGSVYWLRLRGEPAARERWMNACWMNHASCDEQDRLDGWGLMALGVGS